MLSSTSYCLMTAFAAITVAAPNPAVGYMVDLVSHKPSKTIPSTLITSSTTEDDGVLNARKRAAGPLIDDGVDVGHKVYSTHSISAAISSPSSPSSSSSSTYSFNNSTPSGTLVVSLCDSLITLAPREPAVGPIDAVNGYRVSRPRRSRTITTATPTTNADCNLIAALRGDQPRLLRRDPAINKISAVSDGVPNESVISLAGGSPVTMAANDIDALNAVASENPVPIAPFPSIIAVLSVAPSPANNLPPSLYDPPSPTSTGGAIFHVPGTDTELYLYPNPTQPIDKLSMGQVLAEAISELNTLITKPHKDGWLPTNDWTYVRQKWGCIVTVERNEVAGRKGLPQHLTYGILHSAMVGLWGGLFSKGVYRGAKFVIVDGKWGFVGSGSIAPWGNGTVLSP